MDKKPKILFTFIESGMGHITSMQSIVDSMTKNYADEVEIINDYVMQHNESTVKYEKFLTKQVQNTNSIKGFGQFIFGILEIIGAQGLLRALHKTIFKKPFEIALQEIDKFKPDVIVSTHYFITHCAIEYKRRFNPNVLIVTYNPDNNTHLWWDRREGLFFVNNEMAKKEAIKRRRFKEENIRLVSYTKRQCILDTNESKEFYREKYGIPRDKFTVIIADGAYALGESKNFANKLFRTKMPLNILFIAGKNDKMYEYMTRKQAKLKEKGKDNITLQVYHFVPEIHELYRASDLFITKAGPNSILDSVLMGTPVCVNFCPQPMEEAAYKHFVKKLGCGMGVFHAFKIRKVVEACITDPHKLDIYKENIAKVAGSDNGADSVADSIISALRTRGELPAEAPVSACEVDACADENPSEDTDNPIKATI